ncbi:GIY-YIG nuclease family protein [Dyella sp. 20L07]|uniref:GIY-YIG nuclease family protein n=1 Tax=Dyella sp. 20L07 TaxID=3384240 RepID=UPI003D2D4A61
MNPAPPLESLTFSREQLSRLDSHYRRVLCHSDLWQSGTLRLAADSFRKLSGIYFWVMAYGGNMHRIYVGKTNSLGTRVKNYAGDFQPHSPNDFKIQVFQAFARECFGGSELDLYFAPCDLGKLTERENEEIAYFDPLLNRRMKPSLDARNTLKNAFVDYYQSCFWNALDSN